MPLFLPYLRVVAIAMHCPHKRMQLTDQAIIKFNKAQKIN